MISNYYQASDQIQDDEECDEAKTYQDLEINIENANRRTQCISISVASGNIRSLTNSAVAIAVNGGGRFNSASRIPSTMSSHIQINTGINGRRNRSSAFASISTRRGSEVKQREKSL